MPNIVSGNKADLYEGQAIRVSNEISGHYRKVGVILAVHNTRPGVWVTFGRMKRYYLSLDEFDVFEIGGLIQPRKQENQKTPVPFPSEPKYNRFRAVIRIRQEGGKAEIYHTGGPLVILQQPFNLVCWKILEIGGDLVIQENTGARIPLSSDIVQEEFKRAETLVQEIKGEGRKDEGSEEAETSQVYPSV